MSHRWVEAGILIPTLDDWLPASATADIPVGVRVGMHLRLEVDVQAET